MKKRNDVWNMRLLQAHSVPNSLEKRIQQQIKRGERQERQGKRGRSVAAVALGVTAMFVLLVTPPSVLRLRQAVCQL
ncbi:MAG: hypothetical protein KHY89_03260 [Butyricicoccus pullicaecorum]|nr:hypothetical protein [Butyricicoccus pullicaecorum]